MKQKMKSRIRRAGGGGGRGVHTKKKNKDTPLGGRDKEWQNIDNTIREEQQQTKITFFEKQNLKKILFKFI